MFSIVIENDYQDNYFTEKLVDCIYGFSVPIYMGAPNFGSFFDLEGLIIPDSPAHLVELLNKLSANDYYSRLGAMCRNRELSSQFWNPSHRIRQRIENAHAMGRFMLR
jgi:hypothetical protein